MKENVYAGKGMGRRSNYQYGILLKPGVTGKLAQGIGMGQSVGTISFMTPSYEIRESGERLTIDGVELEFQLTPGTEAPAEMNTWLPSIRRCGWRKTAPARFTTSRCAARRCATGRAIYHRGDFPMGRMGGYLPVPQLAALGKRRGERLHGQHGGGI